MLGHDTHGHAEEGTTGCSGVLHTTADDVSHGGNVFGVVSATYTDHGGAGGVPALSTTSQHQIRQKHQEVEFAVNQSGTNTATNTDGGPTPPGTAGVHRGSLGAGDWIQLNGPFNLANINSITFRVADAAAGRTAGSPLAAIEVRQDAPDRAGGHDREPDLDRRHRDLDEPDLPGLAVRHAPAVSSCSGR